MVRPKKKINKKQFESLCAIQCTQAEICSVLDVCEDTLLKWCKETYKLSFSEIYKQKRELGCMSLRRKQMELALNGNPAMQIFLGKNLLNQSDNPTQDKIRLKELELKEREFELREKLLMRQVEDGVRESDVAQAIRDVFGDVLKDVK